MWKLNEKMSLRVRHASYLALSFTKLSNRGDHFLAFYLEVSAEPCLLNFWCSSLTEL